VEYEIGDRVREAFYVALREFGVNILHARDRIDVCAFAAEEFEESLHLIFIGLAIRPAKEAASHE